MQPKCHFVAFKLDKNNSSAWKKLTIQSGDRMRNLYFPFRSEIVNRVSASFSTIWFPKGFPKLIPFSFCADTCISKRDRIRWITCPGRVEEKLFARATFASVEKEKKTGSGFRLCKLYYLPDNNIGIVRFTISIFLLHFDSICDVVIERTRYSRWYWNVREMKFEIDMMCVKRSIVLNHI